MKVTVEKTGPCRSLMTVDLPVEWVNEEYDKVLKAYHKAASIPGFRKGKAPALLVERHYQKEILEEIKETLVGQTYSEALKEQKLNPVAILDLNITVKKGEPVTYNVTLDVPPDFTLPAYKGIALVAKPIEVGEDAVQQRWDEMMRQFTRFEPVSGRVVGKGDLVQIDYEGRCDGKPVADLGKTASGLGRGKDFWAMADENAFLPGFETGLLGAAVGDQKDITVVFPPDFQLKAVAGKTAMYQVSIKAIREKRPPEVTPEFLKPFEVDSEAALREKIRGALLEEARLKEKSRLKNDILEYLKEKTTLELPETVVQEETRSMFATLVRRSLAGGMSKDQVKEQSATLLSSATQSATERVKLGYILHRIADEEHITAEESEVDEALKALAYRYQVTPEALRKDLEEKHDFDAVRHEVRTNKTLDVLLANAKVGEAGFLSRLMGATK